MTENRTLCMVSRIPGVAGPASFQRRFAAGLQRRGHHVEYGWANAEGADAVMVIGGTRQLAQLRKQRKRGTPLVQRLNGMNWIHRQRWTGLSHFLRAELNNLLLRIVRDRADLIVYQSRFARTWWEREHGVAGATAHVVHNGVPLDRYSPDGPGSPPPHAVRMAVIEGRIGGGYEVGLRWALALAEGLEVELGKQVQVVVAGAAEPSVRAQFPEKVRWLGLLSPEEIPGLHRTSHLLFAADLHPACPNSVLEALACGNPVAAFATGAIPEILDASCGAVAPFGADPWQVQDPDIPSLVAAAVPLIENQQVFRQAARDRAEEAFSLERMVDGYLNALGWT
ncbi:MAG: glycosyltransferase family 4 protein [Anaerolineales bacterium]